MSTRIATKLPRVAALVAVTASLGLAITTWTPASASLDKKVTSSQLKSLQNQINKEKHGTYSATYTSLENGKSQTVTIAQAPPKTAFISSGGDIIDTGSKTYFCSKTGSATNCLSTTADNPLLGIEDLFSPAAAVTAFTEAKQGLVDSALGVNAKVTSAKYAGQASTCITITVHKSTTGTYCVTKQGLLSYSGANGSYFKLTSFSSSPASSLFQLPAGATTVTLPGGVTIP